MKTLLLLLFLATSALSQQEITVASNAELKAALKNLKPGDTLKIAPGDYSGGNSISGIPRLTILALDSEKPPHFIGGTEAWHFSRCPDLKLSHLRISGQTGNGLNIDDGSQNDKPVANTVLEHLQVGDIGPAGNHDAIKVSGLINLTVRECKLEGWGGSAIDFVGCHQSVVTGCEFRGKEGFSNSTGIQIKGGSSDVTVEKCRFINAGGRPINAGGSTGLPYFRPLDATSEARSVVIRNNVIEGGQCAVAFVGLDGGEFSDNTILFPEKWIFRILQESRDPRFVPCRNVVIRGNRIVFRRSEVAFDINDSPGTSPETFRFEANQWYAEDQPAKSKPKLPAAETGGTYGTDPR